MKHEPNGEVDAIRYLVLQKLAAGLRHSLLGNSRRYSSLRNWPRGCYKGARIYPARGKR